MLCYSWKFAPFLFLVGTALSTRDGSHEKMYKDLNTNAACFRRLNGTHQFGCSSSRQGDVGIIHIIKTDQDLSVFINNATSENYVIALYMDMFTKDVVNQLLKISNIGGLLLIVTKSHIPEYFSPDGVCPNSAMNTCDDKPINPHGNDFLFIDWPFPMFMVDDDVTIDSIEKCFRDFNLPFGKSQLSRPLCSIQIKSHMSAAVNTPTCLRRESEAGARLFKYCDPMGDRNIILPVAGPGKYSTPRSTIIIATRLDTATMFDGVSSGFFTSATGVVTLLATANVLSEMMKNYDGIADKDVIFMIFNGEAEDYIGSSRIIYDMKVGNFYQSTDLDLNLESIQAFIELSQINANSSLFLHGTKDLFIRDFQNKLIAARSNFSITFNESYLMQLPPSSFLMFNKADPSIPGVIIASYNEQYNNNYFNGFLDSSKTFSNTFGQPFKLLQKNINEISITLATAVFGILTDSKPLVPVDNEAAGKLVHDLLQCYLETKLCRLMKEVYSGIDGSGQSSPWPMYVSVQPSQNPVTTATGLLLAYLTTNPIEISQESCVCDSNAYSCYWISGPNNKGLCLNTTLKFTPAVSPAFLIENYNWTSGNYSTWTESIWFDFGVQMFLKPSRSKEWITFCVGAITFMFSLVSVYWLNKKSSDIFNPSRTSCSLLTTNC